MVLKTLEDANEVDKKQLQLLMSSYPVDEEKKIKEVRSIFQKNNIQILANQIKNEYYEEAMMHLGKVSVIENKKRALKNLATVLLNRQV